VPEAPAPTTASDAGSCSSAHAPLGPDDPAAEVGARDALGDRAGREDDALRGLVLAVADPDLAVAGQPAGALEHLDLVLLEQARDRRP